MPKTSRVSEKGRASAQAALLSLCALLLPASAPHARAANAVPRPAAQKGAAAAKPAKEKPAAQKPRATARVSQETLLRIMVAEDERRWEESDLGALLKEASASV